MEDHPRAARRRVGERQRRDGEDALAVRRPAPRFVGSGAAGLDDDLVGDHERRIEADAELADEIGRLLAGVFGGEPVEEGARAGAGDGAERVDQFGARHADAVVGEGDRVSLGIERDLDAERFARLDQLRLGDRLVAQLLAGVGGVGDELAHEDVAVRIDRMDHQLQEARDVGLETLGLGLLAGGNMRVVGQFRLVDRETGRGGRSRSPAALISRRFSAISRRLGVIAPGKKRGGSARRGPADPPACVAISRPGSPLGGWGAKYTERGAEPNHRGSTIVLTVRCGV